MELFIKIQYSDTIFVKRNFVYNARMINYFHLGIKHFALFYCQNSIFRQERIRN